LVFAVGAGLLVVAIGVAAFVLRPGTADAVAVAEGDEVPEPVFSSEAA